MSPAISLPWARWFSIPFGLFSAGMAGTFWDDRAIPTSLLLLAGSVLLGYAALSLLLNSTSVGIKGDFLVVRHRPLPWPGKRVRVTEIAAVTVASNTSKDSTPTTGWELAAILHGGRTARLTWGPIAGHRYKLLEEAADSLATMLGVPFR